MQVNGVIGVKVATKDCHYFAKIPVVCYGEHRYGLHMAGYYCYNTKYGENSWIENPWCLGGFLGNFSGLDKIL